MYFRKSTPSSVRAMDWKGAEIDSGMKRRDWKINQEIKSMDLVID